MIRPNTKPEMNIIRISMKIATNTMIGKSREDSLSPFHNFLFLVVNHDHSV